MPSVKIEERYVIHHCHIPFCHPIPTPTDWSTSHKTVLNSFSSENEEIENSSSIDQKYMPPTDDLDYSDASSPPRNYSDNYQPLGQLQTDPVNQPGGNLLTSNEANVSVRIERSNHWNASPNKSDWHLFLSFSFQLCSALNLAPTNYLTMKTIFLSDYVSPEDPLTTTENTIKDYLIRSGWFPPLLST